MTLELTRSHDTLYKLLLRQKSCSVSVLPPEEINELEFICSIPGDVTLSPHVEVKISTILKLLVRSNFIISNRIAIITCTLVVIQTAINI